jgi:hypothetical protein
VRSVREAHGIGGRVGSLPGMETPAPDPEKLLAAWMEWERGEVNPGRVMANLKTAGMPDLLRQLVAVRNEQTS